MRLLDFIVIARDTGGIGDYVCLTGLIKLINEKYPNKKIVIITGNEDCLINNPRIKKVFLLKNIWIKRFVRYLIKYLGNIGLPFYNFTYKNCSSGMEEFIKKNPQMHYIEVLSCHIRLDIDYSYLKNELYISNDELSRYEKKFYNLPNDYYLIQSNGKVLHTANKEIGVKIIQKIVDSCRNINWVQIGIPTDAKLAGCSDYRGETKTIRELIYLISRAKAVVCLEGAYNHIAAAFDISSITLFTGFSPMNVYCYSNTTGIQKSILPDCSPCMFLEKCLNNMICVDYEIAAKAIKAIQEIKK